MNPYDRICADVHGAIDNKQVKGVIHDLYHWDDNSKPQTVEGSFAINDPEWINSKCSISLIEKDLANNFTPAMMTMIAITSLDQKLEITLLAMTGPDDYSRETGHIVEVIIHSTQQIPESLVASLAASTTLGAITPLPDELSDYADFAIVIVEHSTENKGSLIIGYLPASKDGRPN